MKATAPVSSRSSATLTTADPRAACFLHLQEIREAIDRVLLSGQYILGPEVVAFEEEFARYIGGGFSIGVANGTDALELALRAAGIRAGDRVATVANTVSATISAIQQIGARPLFVEIDPATQVMSEPALATVCKAFRQEIKAIVPVHLYGYPANMSAIMEIAAENGAIVVEDCAQAHGARVQGRRAGAWGTLAAFSFYPTKNLGALGDGGAVFTRDPLLAERVRLLRQYGWRERYVSAFAGLNSRLDDLQAAILRVKLRHLDRENARRRELAAIYHARLAHLPMLLPAVNDEVEPVYHQFAVHTRDRDELRGELLRQGIAASVLYPVPVHHQPAYEDRAARLPETERACAEVLCLPCHPGLSDADVHNVCDAIVRWFSCVP